MTRAPDAPTASMRTALAVVIPCYNAGDRLRGVLERVCALVDTVVVVDDGSTDGGARNLGHSPARVVTFPANRGKGHALLAGFREALREPAVTCVAVLDADGQHDPAELEGLYCAFLAQNADLAIGTRTFNLSHVPRRSRFGNRLTAALTRLLLRRDVPDTQSGYRLHGRRFLQNVLPTLAGGRYETEMELLVRAVRGGYRVVASPIRTIYEEGNASSHFGKVRDSARIYARLFRTVLNVRRDTAPSPPHDLKGP